MSSSDGDTNKASLKKKIKWYTKQFRLEWCKDPDLKDWLQQDSGNEDFSL